MALGLDLSSPLLTLPLSLSRDSSQILDSQILDSRTLSLIGSQILSLTLLSLLLLNSQASDPLPGTPNHRALSTLRPILDSSQIRLSLTASPSQILSSYLAP